MTSLKKHWRTWVLIGILTDCSVLFAARRIFAAPDVTLSGAVSLADLDGSPRDSDGAVNGIFTVGGNLTLARGARITCGAQSPSGGPCSVRLAVGGNLEMRPASRIFSGRDAGAGGGIEIAVGGDFTMRGSRGLAPGALIRAADGDAASGGAIEIFAVGKVVTEPGSAIVSDAAADGGEISITAAATEIHGGLSARATAAGGRPGPIALASTRDAVPGQERRRS